MSIPPMNTIVDSIRVKLSKDYNSIDSLPEEIVRDVLEYLNLKTCLPGIRGPGDDEHPVNDEYPLLKNMRLVNAAFNKVASRHLFRVIVLYEHPERYSALNQIAATPYLAPWVQRIQLANLGYLPDCEAYEDWYALVTCSPGPCLSSSYFQYPPAGGPFAKLDFAPEACYLRYTVWRDGERIMKEHVKNGTAPTLNLHSLPNLSRVGSVGLREMCVIERKPTVHWNRCSITQPPETRRFYETALIEEEAMKNFMSTLLCHLPTFMIAASTCGKDIRCFTVHRPHELLKSNEYDDSNPAITLRNLRRLEIDLSDYPYLHNYMNDPYQLAPWLHGLTELEELHVYQNAKSYPFSADVIRLLRHISLPKLSTVVFREVKVSFTSLKLFMSKHDKTLKSIDIFQPTMEQEGWGKFHKRFVAGGRRAAGKKIWLSKDVYQNPIDYPRLMDKDD